MRQSLEIRVPMLDEDLFAFGLTLPHHLKVQGRTCKRLLRAVAQRWLPPAVAIKTKHGFGIPVDKWIGENFRNQLEHALLGPNAEISDFFRPEAYRPLVEAFCAGRPFAGITREGLYQRVIMLLSLHLALSARSVPKRI